MTTAINLTDKLNQFADHWSPRTIASLNDLDIMVVKVQGEFVWHTHAEEDEFFLVRKGTLVIRYRDRPEVVLREGDFHVVSKGAEHMTVATEECWVVLVEPAATRHTGETVTEVTKSIEQQTAHLRALT